MSLPTSHHGYGYDRRFAGLFLDQLSLRDHPTYPDNRWFTALFRADYEYQRIGPLTKVNSQPGHRSQPSSSFDLRSARTVTPALCGWNFPAGRQGLYPLAAPTPAVRMMTGENLGRPSLEANALNLLTSLPQAN
jgi:hypothetical protein